MRARLGELLERYPGLAPCADDIARAFDLLAGTYRRGGKVLLCGNGGSAADCAHIVGELMKDFLRPRPVPADVRARLHAAYPDDGDLLADRLQGALPALSLAGQSSLLTATANDIAPEMVFAQQVYGYGVPGDALLGISASGASRNVINALRVGRALGLATIGLTGRSGEAMLAICDVTIRVPADGVIAVQERHLPVYHALCAALEEEFFPCA